MLQPLWPGPIPGYSSGGSCPTLLSAWFWSTLFSSHCCWLPACSHRGIGWWDQAHPPGCSLGPGYLGATGALPAPAGTGGGGSGGEERPLSPLGAEAGADAGHPGSVAAQRSCGTRDAPGSMWKGHQGPHRHHSCGGHGAEWHGRYQQLSLRRPRPSVAADTHRQE